MKKYPISKFNCGIYIAGLLFCIVQTGLSLYLFYLSSVKSWTEDVLVCIWIALIIGFIGVCNGIYLIFIDYGNGKFTLDADGITLYIGGRSYRTLWADCVDYDLLGISVESVGATNVANAYWFYCAKHYLNFDEKRKLLRKTRYRLNELSFFQYSPEPFELMLSYIPEDKARMLRDKAARLEMNALERLYNK